ncbi:MAG: cytochrome d ubiquinol oxidase subunit II [Bifidobacteriaceae bacterium]|jgi:cytochrome d ubiquinol oxidase subunit II|nr:cytochrome d ubiquinol oxidase subunit II [Bifidobacteriaceae bacterium]
MLTEPLPPDAALGALKALIEYLAGTPTALQILWFGLIAVLWTGYLVLEGFDFGVGMLFGFLAKSDREKRAMLTTIGPLWDGNEVWVLTAGGATFAAFPEWYATLFSAAYLPLFLILLGLIVRNVGFEYRGKIDSDRWRTGWDWAITLGSWVPAVLWGVAFGNLVAGVPARVDPLQLGPTKILYGGDFFDLVKNPFCLLGGVVTALLFLAHGAIFTSMKTTGDLEARAKALAPKLMIAATAAAAVWAVWMQLSYSNNTWTWGAVAIAAIALILACLFTLGGREGLAFTSTTVGLASAVVLIFGSLFPNVINASKVTLMGDALADIPDLGLVDGADLTPIVTSVETLQGLGMEVDRAITGLPIVAASSSDLTLKLMTIVACVLVPVVLVYQAWNIWIFRKRVSADRIPAETGLAPSK